MVFEIIVFMEDAMFLYANNINVIEYGICSKLG